MGNFYKFMGNIAGFAVIICAITACSSDDFKKTATFTLEKKGSNAFTVTVEDAKWDVSYTIYRVGYLIRLANDAVSWEDDQNQGWWSLSFGEFPYFIWEKTSDTVVTATFDNRYADKYDIRGIIEFYNPEMLYFSQAVRGLITDGYSYDYFKVNPGKNRLRWP